MVSTLNVTDLQSLAGVTRLILTTPPLLVRSGSLSNLSAVVFNHGQGTRPDLWWGEIEVHTTHGGYAVGTIIKIEKIYEEDENDHGLSLWANATQIGYGATGTDEFIRMCHQSSGALWSISAANVNIKLVGVWF